MKYPVVEASNIAGSGRSFYEFLIQNVKLPAKLNHLLWYNGEKSKLDSPELYAFRGFFPTGTTLELTSGKHTFTGEENFHVFVKDLTDRSKKLLAIPEMAKQGDKVYNYNFVKYEDLPDITKKSNEIATLSMAKALDSFLSRKRGIYYSEKNVVDMINIALSDMTSDEMMALLDGNHIAWSISRYLTSGMEPDITKQFFGQSDVEFYTRDIGTIAPSMLFTLAVLGVDPVPIVENNQIPIWGIMDVAYAMRNQMAKIEVVNE